MESFIFGNQNFRGKVSREDSFFIARKDHFKDGKVVSRNCIKKMGPNVVLFFFDHRSNYFPICTFFCLLHPIEVNILRQAPCGIVIIMG